MDRTWRLLGVAMTFSFGITGPGLEPLFSQGHRATPLVHTTTGGPPQSLRLASLVAVKPALGGVGGVDLPGLGSS